MKNPRIAFAGLFLIAVGAGLFTYFMYHQEDARDPEELMRVVGQVAGAVAGLGVALIAMAFFIKPRQRRG